MGALETLRKIYKDVEREVKKENPNMDFLMDRAMELRVEQRKIKELDAEICEIKNDIDDIERSGEGDIIYVKKRKLNELIEKRTMIKTIESDICTMIDKQMMVDIDI